MSDMRRTPSGRTLTGHDPERTEVVTEDHTDDDRRVVVTERELPDERTHPSVDRDAHERVVGPAPIGLAIRVILTVLGAAALALATFFEWLTNGVEGRDLPFEAFWQTSALSESADLATSVGVASLALAGLALLGFVTRSGWLTRTVGALAMIAFGAFAVTVYRADGVALPQDLGLGAWLVLAGGILVVVAGFFGIRVRTRHIED